VEETIRLLDLDDNRLGALVSSNELDPKLRQRLGEIATRRQAVGHQRAELGHFKEQRAQLVEDETRLRNDLAVVGSDPALHKRLLDKFAETENGIETVSAALAKASDALAAAERDLASYIGGLAL
jgi:chromosome segregation ATPase